MNEKKPNALVFAALVVIQVLFGVNFVAMKIVVSQLPPLLWAGVRVLCAAAIMVLVCLVLKRKHPKPDRAFFGKAALFAILAIAIAQGAVTVGLKYTTATNAAILYTLIPVFTLVIVTLRGQEALTKYRVIGFLFAFSGVLLLKKVEQLTFSNATLGGDFLILISVFAMALFLTYGKRFTQSYDRLWTTAYLFIFGGVALICAAGPTILTGFTWPAMSPTLMGSMVYVIIGGTLLPYFLNVWALAKAPSSAVAIFAYLQPVVAAALIFFLTGDSPSARTVISVAIIFAGLLVSEKVWIKESSSPS